jgi:MFS family permease
MPQPSRRRLIAEHADLRRLLTARLVSEAGTWLAYIALALDVYGRTHSGAWLAGLLLVQEGAMLAVGVVLGPLTDRLSRRRLLVVSDLLSAGVFSGLVVVGSAEGVVALAAVAGAVGALYQPTLGAALPNLVAADDLPAANALSQTVATSGLAVGPLAAGALIAAFGPHGAYAVNAVSFLLSALVLSRIGSDRLQEPAGEPSPRGHRARLLEGIRLFARDAELLGLLASWTFVGLAFAAVNVAEVVLARHVLHAGAAGYGLFASAMGAGLVAGGLASPRVLANRQPSSVYASSLVAGAAAMAVIAAAPSLAVAVVGGVVSGAANGVLLAARTLTVQRAVADAVRGRAFAVLLSAGQASMVAGMALAGLAVDGLGARAVFAGGAVLLAVAALPMLAPKRHVAVVPA